MTESINPDQFGDQGTLFDAPLGQPARGTFDGNPHARLYRSVGLHEDSVGVYRYAGGFGYEAPPKEEFHERILQNINRRRKDGGHDVNMGIHWQHDLPTAVDWSNDISDPAVGLHRDRTLPVIIEADHPGLENIVQRDPDARYTPVPENPPKDPYARREAMDVGRWPTHKRNKATGPAKDWALIHDTVGPHDMDAWMAPEVPVRPGTPMRVHAIHTPDPENTGQYIRNPVQFEGYA